MAKKKATAPAKKKAALTVCPACDEPINKKYGTTRCSNCEEEKCTEFCIPGGALTSCVACEEAEEEDDE